VLPSARSPEISIVLNLHNEARFLRRTMMSIGEAVSFAAPYGISCEIVCVLDRPDPNTRAWIEAYDFSRFADSAVIEVSNGSLGPSRNAGIARARGAYIWLCDADDLISYNILAGLYRTSVAAGPKTIAVPEFLCAFGADFHLARYFGTDKASKLLLFHMHPFISRIFSHRSLFDDLRFSDARLGLGFAYEDWHFNCEALACGYEFHIAPQTIFFYRRRADSLGSVAYDISVQHPMLSAYHEPCKFLWVCEKDFIAYRGKRVFEYDHAQVRRDVLSNPVLLELIHAANQIDPAIDPERLPSCPVLASIDSRWLPAGAAYYRACQQIADLKFSYVFLLPFLTTGGADKYILEFIAALTRIDPGARILLLFGQRLDRHAWLDRLPSTAMFIDLPALDPALDQEAINLVTLRLLQACTPGATVFMKTCEFAIDFFKKFSVVLTSHSFYYFYFSDKRVTVEGLTMMSGYSFDFLSEFGERLSGVITDNSSLVTFASTRLDRLAGRMHAIYAPVDPPKQRRNYRAAPMARRLLWASRLDVEKRPSLLCAIGRALEVAALKVTIDVFGSAVLNQFDTGTLQSTPHLEYKGPFDDFYTLRPWEYDAFLYTSAYDGLPNVVLEAMSAGLVVIAPSLGGIPEAVTPESGFLVTADGEDEHLARAYVECIARLYSGDCDLAAMSEAAFGCIATRHTRDELARRVAGLLVPSPVLASAAE